MILYGNRTKVFSVSLLLSNLVTIVVDRIRLEYVKKRVD